MRKCRRGEGHPSFVRRSAPSPGMLPLHTPALLASSCLCWWVFAYRHFMYLIRRGEMNLTVMTLVTTLVTKSCRGPSDYRISESEHQLAKIQAAAAAQPYFMEGAALEIYLRAESSSRSSLYSPLQELRQAHFPYVKSRCNSVNLSINNKLTEVTQFCSARTFLVMNTHYFPAVMHLPDKHLKSALQIT